MKPLVVVGDALLDVDVDGRTDRLCPDAPVPVLDVLAEHARPGGAGLAAGLLAAGDVPVVLVTALVDDPDGARLRSLLEPWMSVIAGPAGGGTVRKVRMLAGGRPLLRVDRGEGRPAAGFGAAIGRTLAAAFGGASAVLVSDYGRGVAADPTVRAKLARAIGRGVPVVWDPHPRGPDPVPDVTIATPNLAEARGAIDAGPDVPETMVAGRLLDRWGCGAVAVTLGERGALLSHRAGDRVHVPTRRAVSGDPCGAGDAFAGRVAALLADGAGVEAAVRGAVVAAQSFVAAGGAGALSLRPAS